CYCRRPMAGGKHLAFAFVLGVAACGDVEPKTGGLRPPLCQDVDSNPAVSVNFETQLRPLINNEVAGTRGCIGCHSPTSGTMEGFLATGLDLTKLQLIRKGSTDDTDIVVPGKPCESLIVQKLEGTDPEGVRMPKGGPYWAPDKIQLMVDWIAEGAQ